MQHPTRIGDGADEVERASVALHWKLKRLPESRDIEFAWHDNGDITLGSRTFTLAEEIAGHKFGGGLVAWRPTSRMQTIDFDFDGHTHTCVIDHHQFCGWRCLGTAPILVIQNVEFRETWFFVYQPLPSRCSGWYRMTPARGEVSALETVAQLKRVAALLFVAACVGGCYLVVTSIFAGVCQLALGS